jgi:hypothetical protein
MLLGSALMTVGRALNANLLQTGVASRSWVASLLQCFRYTIVDIVRIPCGQLIVRRSSSLLRRA